MSRNVSLFSSVKSACEPRGTDLQDLLSLAEAAATSIERLVLDGKFRHRQSECFAHLPSMNHGVAAVNESGFEGQIRALFQIGDPWVCVKFFGI